VNPDLLVAALTVAVPMWVEVVRGLPFHPLEPKVDRRLVLSRMVGPSSAVWLPPTRTTEADSGGVPCECSAIFAEPGHHGKEVDAPT
jgi:hypothetical protein